MIPAIAEAAFRLQVNRISEPVKSPYGYHLVKVTDLREAKRFEELPPPILGEVKRAILQEEIDALKASNKITVNMEPLKRMR